MKSRAVWAGLVAAFVLAIVVMTMQGRRADRAANRTRDGAASRAAKAGVASTSRDSDGQFAPESGRRETGVERRLRMMSNEAYRDDFKMSEHDIYLYVQAKGSNALSLVAAFESTRDKDYLKAAVEKYPNDPFVQAKALMWLDLSPEEREKLINGFKKSAPDNAFANLLAAQAAMKRGDTQTAAAEIAAAKGKRYDEFFRESAEGLQDAHLAAGRSEADAKTLGMSEITLPHLAQFKAVGKQFLDMAEKAAAAGDTKAQQEFLVLNSQIGQLLRNNSGSVPIITELVGIAMENATLRAWPAGTPFGQSAPADILAANARDRDEMRSGVPVFEKWFPTAPEEEIVDYMNRIKTSGEREAFAWLREQHPELVTPVK